MLIDPSASLCSIMRLDCIIHLSPTQKIDLTLSTWLAELFQGIEVPLGIICICVPTLAPVWSQITQSRIGSLVKQMFSSAMGSGGASGSSGNRIKGFSGSKESSSKMSRSKNFQQINNGNFETYNNIEFTRSDELPLHDMVRMPNDEENQSVPGDIKVTQGWEVRHS